jgi:hypothetical protein
MLKQPPKSIQDFQEVEIENRIKQRKLLLFFWFAVSVYAIFFVDKAFSAKKLGIEDVIGSISISAASMVSIYLWCAGKAFGVPIFPMFSATYLWTCALPLLNETPGIFIYTGSERFIASITVTGFLLLATLTWYGFQTLTKNTQPKNYYRALETKKGELIFLGVLLLGNFFTVFSSARWLDVDQGLFSIIRGAILGLVAISSFIMAYQFGRRNLSRSKAILYLVLITVQIIANAASLLLVGSLTLFLISVIGYSLGKGKLPLVFIVIMLSLFTVLHAGKSDIRSLYWQQSVEPLEYVSRYAEWINFGVNRLFSKEDSQVEAQQSLLERSSILQQILLTQSATQKGQPLLNGATYAIVPQLLIPRIFNPEKITSHEGTTILNIHYGRQTREDTLSTTIGWGLLAESYANFGFLGCALLALICGVVYGYIGLLSHNAPIFSDRFLFAILFFSYSFQTEFTAGVYIAALFQSSVTLFIFSLLFMKKKKVGE